MRITHWASIGIIASGLLLGQAASAVPIDVTIQGTAVRDIFAPTLFGSTDSSFPFQFSFTLDSDAAVVLPSGSPVVISTGASFGSAAYLFGSADLSNFQAFIGDQSFAAGNLLNQALGTSGHIYDVLLLGSLSSPGGITGVQFSMYNGLGSLTLGSLTCFAPTCALSNFGSADDGVGGFGSLSDITVFTQMRPTSVPEPSALALLGMATIVTFAASRRRRRLAS